MKIETSNMSGYEWHAMTDSYEPGMPLGIGATEAEAIADLKEQLAEAEPDAGYQEIADRDFARRVYEECDREDAEQTKRGEL